jgi:hypothetical protein
MEPTSNAEMLRQMMTPGTEWDPFTKFNVVLVALLRLLPGAEEKQRRVFEEARAIVARSPEHIQTALDLAGLVVNDLTRAALVEMYKQPAHLKYVYASILRSFDTGAGIRPRTYGQPVERPLARRNP